MRMETAIAYSCNCFVAHVAERFAPGELASMLDRAGFTRGIRLAQGEAHVCRRSARRACWRRRPIWRWRIDGSRSTRPPPVLAGLEGAVEYGTAQLARGRRALQLAGKTGRFAPRAGNRIAWFAGFFPSRAPRVAIAVMIAGYSGGADAAPVAGRILAAYQAGSI